MLASSLSLTEPWYVKGAEFDANKSEIHIHVDIRSDAAFVCPICGAKTKRYGYEPKERMWRHADCLFYPCYVHCCRPRVLCDKCGVQQISAPFERANSRFTLMFEGYAMLIMADVPRAKAARLLRCNEKSLASILSYWVKDAVDKTKLDDIKSIAIDETSFKKGHSYVTVAIDADKRRVFDVEPDRDKKAVASVATMLKNHGGDPLNVQSATSDMSKTYLPAIKEHFPNAKQVIDKFHVKQMFLKSLDEVRKQEQANSLDKKSLFQARKLIMIPESRMDEKQTARMKHIANFYPKTGKAFRMVQVLDLFYEAPTKEEGEAGLDKLCSWMLRSRLSPMIKMAQTLRNHKAEILNYFEHRLTNAICEGINSMIQAAKRKARGFRTFEGYSSMIYLIAGKLKLAVPTPL